MKLITALLALSVAAFAGAQEMMDMTPPKEVKNLEAFFAGEWKGTITMTEPDGKSTTSTSTIIGKVSLAGRYIESRHKFAVPGMTWEGMHLATYDADAKTYKAWWFDSMAAGSMEMSGPLTGNKLVMTSKPTDMPGMPGMIMRATWDKTTAKSYNFLLEMKQGEGWVTVISGKYEKVK
jgi:hypothetical protein